MKEAVADTVERPGASPNRLRFWLAVSLVMCGLGLALALHAPDPNRLSLYIFIIGPIWFIAVCLLLVTGALIGSRVMLGGPAAGRARLLGFVTTALNVIVLWRFIALAGAAP